MSTALSGSALLLCDVWDTHTCRAAAKGTERIAYELAGIVEAVRASGGRIIHAPSDTMDNYADHPARRWVRELPRIDTPPLRGIKGWPLPEDASPAAMRALMERDRALRFPIAECLEEPICVEPTAPPWPWSGEHPAITIRAEDAILDSADDMLAVISAWDIEHVYLAGVHTNQCVLNRPFAIKRLVGWGVSCSLARELTEALPATLTQETIEYIEQYWCPTVTTAELLKGVR